MLTKEPDWIVAERKTAIKPGTGQAASYHNAQVTWVSKGDKFFVSSFEEAPGSHWKITIDDPSFNGITDRFIYDGDSPSNSHWLKSWENDTVEQEIVAAPNVVSTERKDQPVGESLTPEMPFSTRITPNFTYGEFSLYQEGRRFHHKHQCDTAYLLAMFLEEVRSEFGDNTLRISSGFRPFEINRKVGGARNSEHLYSAPLVGAVDITTPNVPIVEVQNYCLSEWRASVGKGAEKRGFVHLGMRGRKDKSIIWIY